MGTHQCLSDPHRRACHGREMTLISLVSWENAPEPSILQDQGKAEQLAAPKLPAQASQLEDLETPDWFPEGVQRNYTQTPPPCIAASKEPSQPTPGGHTQGACSALCSENG